MQYVERSVVIVRPRQPFADWVQSVDEEGLGFNLEEQRAEPVAYLVDNLDDHDQLDRVLRSCWQDIFEAELDGWLRDPDRWPANRTFKKFKDWFDCELVVSVTDLGVEPVYVR